MNNNVNDNERLPRPVSHPDADGQAALLLTESLLHTLVERAVIGLHDAIAVVETAADVEAEIAVDLGETAQTTQRSVAILEGIEESLTTDLHGGKGLPCRPKNVSAANVL